MFNRQLHETNNEMSHFWNGSTSMVNLFLFCFVGIFGRISLLFANTTEIRLNGKPRVPLMVEESALIELSAAFFRCRCYFYVLWQQKKIENRNKITANTNRRPQRAEWSCRCCHSTAYKENIRTAKAAGKSCVAAPAATDRWKENANRCAERKLTKVKWKIHNCEQWKRKIIIKSRRLVPCMPANYYTIYVSIHTISRWSVRCARRLLIVNWTHWTAENNSNCFNIVYVAPRSLHATADKENICAVHEMKMWCRRCWQKIPFQLLLILVRWPSNCEHTNRHSFQRSVRIWIVVAKRTCFLLCNRVPSTKIVTNANWGIHWGIASIPVSVDAMHCISAIP